MVRVVGVRFKKAGKIYYFDPADHPVSVGCKVIVETARGLEYGDVAIGPKYVPEEEVVQPLRPVIRVATEADALQAQMNKAKEREAFAIALERIEAHGLDMNLVDVEYTFDGSKIIFSFTAEGRVDFRELVRDLASIFRTRIEMRQIGVRDEAKLIGGIGPCGRILCCTSFLGEFAPVSIRMAKDQNLALNPSKISGLCGRLMCCLRFEQDTYEAAKQDPSLAPGYVPPVVPPEEEVAEPEPEPTLASGWLKTAAEILGTEEEVGGRLGRAVAERNAALSEAQPDGPVAASAGVALDLGTRPPRAQEAPEPAPAADGLAEGSGAHGEPDGLPEGTPAPKRRSGRRRRRKASARAQENGSQEVRAQETRGQETKAGGEAAGTPAAPKKRSGRNRRFRQPKRRPRAE